MIQDRLEEVEITHDYEINKPTTKEQKYYRDIFTYYHADCDHLIPYFWMPKYVHATDASARTLSQYKHTNTLNE
jgi:asparagine synthase (glutamine-hydrolysing)